LATAEFAFNNKVYIFIKLLSFKVNYGKKEMYKKVKAVLKKSQEKMKKYTDRNRKEAVEYKVKDKMLLSAKYLQ